MKHKYLWATSLVVLGLAWACSPAEENDDMDVPGDGDGDGDGSGATPGDGDGDGDGSGGIPGDGDATGGTAGGTPMGGSDNMGGEGGEAPTLSVEESCALWCAAVEPIGCADDPDEVTCNAECVDFVWPGCESEYVAMKSCQAAAPLECTGIEDFDRAALQDFTVCQSEVDADFACYEANP